MLLDGIILTDTGEATNMNIESGPADPTTNLDIGQLFFNTTENKIKIYNGSIWEAVSTTDTYSKAEIDAKDTAIITGLDWKEAVATFADLATTYPNPVEGWTASVNDEDLIYRYDGTQWLVISGGATSNPSIVTTSTDYVPTYPKVGIETLTGKRHPVSGKPIYTQTWTGFGPNPANDFTVTTGLVGIEQCNVTDVGYLLPTGVVAGLGLSYIIGDTSEFSVYSKNDGSIVYVNLPDTSADWAGGEYYVTLEYTKIADTVDSPIAILPQYITSRDPVYPVIDKETLTDRRHPITGKPIYTRAYVASIPNPAVDFTIATGLTGIDYRLIDSFYYVRSDGLLESNNSTFSISNTSELRVLYQTLTETIDVRISDSDTNPAGQQIVIILEYTKSADTSDSPVAGVPIKIVTDETYPRVGTETLTSKRDPVSGKPIYTQVFSGNFPNPAADIAINTGLTGIDVAKVCGFRVVNGGGNTFTDSLSYNISDTNQLYAYCSTDGATYYLNVPDGNANYANAPYYVILEYTKTVDTSSSPIASVSIPVQPGETLQTLTQYVPPLAANQTFVLDQVIFTQSITPKSGNSKFIIDFQIPVYLSAQSERVYFGLKVDGVLVPDFDQFMTLWNGDNDAGEATTNTAMAFYNNTDINQKTIEILVTDVQGTANWWNIGVTTLKVTEIQN